MIQRIDPVELRIHREPPRARAATHEPHDETARLLSARRMMRTLTPEGNPWRPGIRIWGR